MAGASPVFAANGSPVPSNGELCVVMSGDMLPPDITCPPDVTVSTNASCEVTVSNLVPLTTINGGTVTQSPIAGSILQSGEGVTHTITLTVDDGNGNTANCMVVITAEDITAPSPVCEANATLALNSNCELIVTDVVDGSSAPDNCGFPFLTQSPTAGTALASGDGMTHTITVTADDGNGNTATCFVTLTCDDITPASPVCEADATIILNSSCELIVTDVTDGSSANDNCGSPVLMQSPTAGTALASGDGMTHTITVIANDGNGNTAACFVTLTGDDITPASPVCEADATVALNSNCELIVTNVTDGSSANDNCGSPVLMQSPTAGTALASGDGMTHTITVIANDGNGNTAACFVTLTGDDTTPPVAACPTNITQGSDVGYCDAVVTFTLPPSADNCPGGSTVATPASGAAFPVGITTVTVTATDGSGNTDDCSFTVTVNDTEAPVASCPTNITQGSDVGYCDAVVTFTLPSADNCPGGSTVATPASGAAFPVGTTTVTVTATDGSGNTDDCSFTVTVNDTEAPSITCPSNTTVAAGGSCTGTVGSYVLASKSDNCAASGSISESQANSGDGNLSGHNDSETVTLTATDPAGNTATCSFTVTLKDVTAPSVTCNNLTVALDANGTATIAAASVRNTASDNCTAPGSIALAASPNTFGCADVGTPTTTLTATDVAGNPGTCTATVTVLDVLNYSQEAQRIASDGLANDKLGGGIGLDGPLAIAGAPRDKVGTQSQRGSAYIFLQDQGGPDNWGQLKQIKASDGLTTDYFGNAIAIDGGLALVAAHGDQVGTIADAGSVYIFEQNLPTADNWGQQANIIAQNGATAEPVAYDYFGNAAALKNGRAVVGAAQKKVGANNAQGAVYIYEQNAGGPNAWGNVKKLVASDGAANNFFGRSVAQTGSLALVGASGHLSNRGAAYLFDGSSAWAQTQKLMAADAAVGDGFGTSVSISDDYAVIGAPNKAGYAGVAYVFKNNAGTWSQVKKLVASDAAAQDRLGTTVSLSGDYAYASALRGNANTGAVYVFHRNMGGPDNWGQIGRYIATGGLSGDEFGFSLAVSGERMAVGAYLDDVSGKLDQGSIYIFKGDACPTPPRPTDGTLAATPAQPSAPSVKCSPNPFADELQIEIGGIENTGSKAQIKLMNATGHLVLEAEMPSGARSFSLKTNGLQAGLYFLQASTDGGVRVVPVALVR